MKTLTIANVMLSLFMACLVAGVMASRRHRDDGKRYLPVIAPLMLPTLMLTLLVMNWFMGREARVLMTLYSWLGSIVVIMSVYYVVIALMLPVLRKHYTSEICAVLWLLPNCLYITQYATWQMAEPVFIINVPGNALKMFTMVWAAGFVIVLAYYLFSNAAAGKRILEGSYPETDPVVLALWLGEQRRIPPLGSAFDPGSEDIPASASDKRYIRLLRSPSVTSPLALGLSRKKLRTVLPERDYSEEELKLIFDHELVHLRRDDPSQKLFLCFIRALCWFDPLVWLAVRKSTEDMEFSCDEAVTEGFDEEGKKTYASLIIDTAGEAAGFTTCLSASAESLRYRLKRIIDPAKRKRGYLLAGIAVFLLVSMSGIVAFSYDERKGAECFFPGGTENYEIKSVTGYMENGWFIFYDVNDETAFKEYLSGITVRRLSSLNYLPYGDVLLHVSYTDGSGLTRMIVFYERSIVFGDMYNRDRQSTAQGEGYDMDVIMGMLTEKEIEEFGFMIPEVQLDLENGQVEEPAFRFISADGIDWEEDPEPTGSCSFTTSSGYAEIEVLNAVPVEWRVELTGEDGELISSFENERIFELPEGKIHGIIRIYFYQSDPEGYFTMEYSFDAEVRQI